MKLIRRVESSPFFINQSGNPLEFPSTISLLYDLISNSHYTVSDPEIPYYLNRISEDMLISVSTTNGPDPLEHLSEILEGETDIPDGLPEETCRFWTFYVLGGIHAKRYDVENGVELIQKYQEEFEENAYFGKIKAEILEQAGDRESLNKAIEVIHQSRCDFSRYPEVQATYARIIASSLERDHIYDGEVEEIPRERDGLLEEAANAISQAVTRDNIPPEYQITMSRIKTLLGDFDSAEKWATDAISELSRNRGRYEELRAEFGREITRIRTVRQQQKLQRLTSEIDNKVNKLEDSVEETELKLGEFNKELDRTTRDFRRSMLEFLGFFSAIIAVIVTSGQIALGTSSTNDAARLMLVSYGGLLFTFGGFSVLLSQNQDTRRMRIWMMIAGVGLLSLAASGHIIINFIQTLV